MKPSLLILFICLACKYPASALSPGLTAVYEHGRQAVKLRWQHNDKRIVRYLLQTSLDHTSWTNLYEIKISNPQQTRFISLTDNKVMPGKNYYRLKAILADACFAYSSPIMVIMGQTGKNWLIYPVPVKDVLHLQYNGTHLIPGVICVFIQHIGGRIFHKLRYASSARHIEVPVQNLGSGIYVIRIVVNDEVVWNQRFVK